MALATNSTPGSIVLAGDLTGNANAPELRPTGVVPGTYASYDIVVDSKGRIVHTQPAGTNVAGYSVKGVVQVSQSTGLTLSGGDLYGALGTNTTEGVIKSGNATNVTISAGSIDVGSNIPLTISLNVFTKSIRNAYASSSGVSLTPSFQNTSIYNFSSGATLPIVNNPSTYVDGDEFTITTTTTAAGSNPQSVAGYQIVDVGSNKTTGSATGLGTLNYYGYQFVNVGGSKTTGSATGLDSTQDSNGSQTVNVGSNKVAGSATGLSTTAATSGYFTYPYSPALTEATTCPAAFYSKVITIDGVKHTITGNGQTTVGALLTYLNTQMSSYATIAIVAGNLVVTSKTTGSSSSADCLEYPSPNLFDQIPGIAGGRVPVTGTAAAVYSCNITIDGTLRSFNIPAGPTIGTYTGLMAALTSAVGSYASFGIVSGNLRVSSNTIGTSSTVSIGTSSVFTNLTGYTSYASAISGTAATVYTATVQWNGGTTSTVSIKGSAAQTYANLINEINTDIGANGTASMSSGNLKITSALGGNGSAVLITNTNLFNVLTGYVSIPAAVPGASYLANISVNGTLYAVDCGYFAIPRYSDLITVINGILGVAGAASISGGNLVITSATSGAGSTVSILPTNLFTLLTNYGGVRTAIPGSTQYDYVTTFGNMYKFSNAAPHSQTQTFSGIVNNNKCYCTYQQ